MVMEFTRNVQQPDSVCLPSHTLVRKEAETPIYAYARPTSQLRNQGFLVNITLRLMPEFFLFSKKKQLIRHNCDFENGHQRAETAFNLYAKMIDIECSFDVSCTHINFHLKNVVIFELRRCSRICPALPPSLDVTEQTH